MDTWPSSGGPVPRNRRGWHLATLYSSLDTILPLTLLPLVGDQGHGLPGGDMRPVYQLCPLVKVDRDSVQQPLREAELGEGASGLIPGLRIGGVPGDGLHQNEAGTPVADHLSGYLIALLQLKQGFYLVAAGLQD